MTLSVVDLLVIDSAIRQHPVLLSLTHPRSLVRALTVIMYCILTVILQADQHEAVRETSIHLANGPGNHRERIQDQAHFVGVHLQFHA